MGGAQSAQKKKSSFLFQHIDKSNKGHVIEDDIKQWLEDERFAGNSLFTEDINVLSHRIFMEASGSTNEDSSVAYLTKDQFTNYFSSLHPELLEKLGTSVFEKSHRQTVDAIAANVMASLDPQGRGYCQRSELLPLMNMPDLDQKTTRELTQMVHTELGDKIFLRDLQRFLFGFQPSDLRSLLEDSERKSSISNDINVADLPPKLNILILIVGSRGDVQPFIPIGLRLQSLGHRVRLSTHETFRDFVLSNGLEFYPVGADPEKLMAYMVKTRGRIVPTVNHLMTDFKEDYKSNRVMLKDIIQSTWGSATAIDPVVLAKEREKKKKKQSKSNPLSPSGIETGGSWTMVKSPNSPDSPNNEQKEVDIFKETEKEREKEQEKEQDTNVADVGSEICEGKEKEVVVLVNAQSAVETPDHSPNSPDQSQEGSENISQVENETKEETQGETEKKSEGDSDAKDAAGGANENALESKIERGVNEEVSENVKEQKSEAKADVKTEEELERAAERERKAKVLKKRQDRMARVPFVADAIISNPTTYTHIHLAQALHIPLHMFFTMPWSRTEAFPHPLSNMKYGTIDRDKEEEAAWVKEFQTQQLEGKAGGSALSPTALSYAYVDSFMWTGCSDYLNDFRREHHLPTLGITDGPYLIEKLKVPFGYIWSPALIPKPKDWGNHIDVVGFSVLKGSGFKGDPPKDIEAWINKGSPPIFVGFGSCVLESPDEMAQAIIGAAKSVGVRVIMQLGWSQLGKGYEDIDPDNVLVIAAVPHDWLFRLTAGVVHHGGAGTTCAGLLARNPTLVVPFFGDQPFWGAMIANAGAGPRPIPPGAIKVSSLTKAFQVLLKPETKAAAIQMGAKMSNEDGITESVKVFMKRCNPGNLRCDVLPSETAKVYCAHEDCRMRLSLTADYVIHEDPVRALHRRRVYRPENWASYGQPHYTDILYKPPKDLPNLFWNGLDEHRPTTDGREIREMVFGNYIAILRARAVEKRRNEITLPPHVHDATYIEEHHIAITFERDRAMSFSLGEKPLYHYVNTSNPVAGSHNTKTCIILTNRRFMKLEKGQQRCVELLSNITRAERGRAPGLLRYDRLNLILKDGTAKSCGIWGQDCCEFFARIINLLITDHPTA